ncbi:hypothetical protein OG21DRAFT_1505210 [Imleria badia]|nr:hypothetical protein OG21DRAFT_1505210 [Imleria badia]
MIRRPPTMIPMTDADVQDIRALVARHKAANDVHQKALSKLKTLPESPDPIVVPEATTAALVRQLADRARERDERQRRMGIPPGQRSS